MQKQACLEARRISKFGKAVFRAKLLSPLLVSSIRLSFPAGVLSFPNTAFPRKKFRLRKRRSDIPEINFVPRVP